MKGVIMPGTKEHWRWNVNPTWEHFSSMCQECHEAMAASNEFLKYHHIRTSLYFGIGAIEAFLNERMRNKLRLEGLDEDKIVKKLRHSYFNDKLEKWPSELSDKKVEVPIEVIDLIRSYGSLRGEITHPKQRDHTIYKYLDEFDVSNMPSIVAEYIVRIHEGCGETFPYWLLRWNYIGMGTDYSWPSLINNQQFLYSLSAFGLRTPIPLADPMKEWEIVNMSTVKGYQALYAWLARLQRCEPKDPRYPHKPRLCRKWWDREHQGGCGIAS
jgi:hypothetical protein